MAASERCWPGWSRPTFELTTPKWLNGSGQSSPCSSSPSEPPDSCQGSQPLACQRLDLQSIWKHQCIPCKCIVHILVTFSLQTSKAKSQPPRKTFFSASEVTKADFFRPGNHWSMCVPGGALNHEALYHWCHFWSNSLQHFKYLVFHVLNGVLDEGHESATAGPNHGLTVLRRSLKRAQDLVDSWKLEICLSNPNNLQVALS